jgi:peroxiredoxin
MKFKAIALFSFMLSLAVARATAVTIDGVLTIFGNAPQRVELYCYADPSFSQAAVITGGKFKLNIVDATTGVYTLRINSTNLDVMINPLEPVLNFKAVVTNGRASEANTGESIENKAYQALLATAAPYDKKIYLIYTQCGASDSCQQELHNLLTEYRAAIEIIQNNYPSTYTALMPCRLKKPYISKNIKQTAQEYRSHFFGAVPFSDPAILAVPVYKEMISMYTDFLLEPGYAQQQQFITSFMDSTSHHPRVYSQSAYTLFEQLLRWSREKTLGMFIDWYPAHRAQINNSVLDLKVNNTAKVMPGQPVVEISLPDTGKHLISIKEVVAKSKCTLLLFWSSECSHCRQEMPLIKQLYQRYHAQGLEIYSISLDPDAAKWKSYIKTESLPWIHTLCGEQASPNPVMEYGVLFTPSLVLIGADGKIKHRFDNKNTIEAHIQEVLGR